MKGFLVYFMLSRKLESEEVVVNVVFSFLYETSLKVIIFFCFQNFLILLGCGSRSEVRKLRLSYKLVTLTCRAHCVCWAGAEVSWVHKHKRARLSGLDLL